MNVLRELRINSDKDEKSIYFGMAEESGDLEDIYRLRYKVYADRGYINASKYPDQIEKDGYDIAGKCKYFIAKLEDKIIGCIRMIVDDPLPTEKAFEFNEPEELHIISREKRCELGRFIIIPPNKEKGEYLPRGLVMLFLIDVLSSYGLENNLLGGYSFVKKSLERKMDKMKMPIRKIKIYRQVYNKDGDLYNYFNQPDDLVVPIFFFTKDFHNYSEHHIHNAFMFKKDGLDRFILRDNIYTDFLKTLKIL